MTLPEPISPIEQYLCAILQRLDLLIAMQAEEEQPEKASDFIRCADGEILTVIRPEKPGI